MGHGRMESNQKLKRLFWLWIPEETRSGWWCYSGLFEIVCEIRGWYATASYLHQTTYQWIFRPLSHRPSDGGSLAGGRVPRQNIVWGQLQKLDENKYACGLHGDAWRLHETAWLDPSDGDGRNPKFCVGTVHTHPHASPYKTLNGDAWGNALYRYTWVRKGCILSQKWFQKGT